MKYISTIVTLILILGSSTRLGAQGRDTARVYVWPPELYPGENVVQITAGRGIREITSIHSPNIVVEEDAGSSSCPQVQQLTVRVISPSIADTLEVQVEDCTGRMFGKRIPMTTRWDLDRIDFGRIEVGTRSCQTFRITPNIGLGLTLDSVTTSDRRVTFRFLQDPPVRLPLAGNFNYVVCFKADEVGDVKFPVITWIHRRYPFGGLSSYPVADTGIVRVVPKRVLDDLPEPEAPFTDPTTFRSVSVPNAVIPKRGTATVGIYDFLGLMGGYSITDGVMLLAGGALPTPDDWGGVRGDMYGAISLGAKAGIRLGTRLDLAAGVQVGQSIFDQQSTSGVTDSKISFAVPWGAASYGDDDSRISATFGYALKRHVKPEVEFTENAAFVALGGDYRFADHWKIAGETAFIETLGVIPVIATARYFTSTFAIDVGLGFAGITTEGGKAPSIPVFPVLSGVFVF